MNKYAASNSVYFCLCLADSVAREIQKTKRILIVLFCLLVASLRFSLMYPCVQFVVFFGSPTVIGKIIMRLIALWPKDVYISSFHFVFENCPEPSPVFLSIRK